MPRIPITNQKCSLAWSAADAVANQQRIVNHATNTKQSSSAARVRDKSPRQAQAYLHTRTTTRHARLLQKSSSLGPIQVMPQQAETAYTHWLAKAEPDARMENGVDVSFGLDKFKACKDQTTSWEGVRAPEARNHLRDRMKLNHKVLFYHSNCKLPGVAAIARVVKEGYPDHTAFDPQHPYHDCKSSPSDPKWYMVDVKLDKALEYFVPFALLQHLASSSFDKNVEQVRDVAYLTEQHLQSIKGMQLLNRGRLSVQPVTDEAYEAILLLGSRGGWSEWPGKWKAAAAAASSRGSLSAKNEETCVQNVEPQKAKQKAGNGGNSKRKVTNDMHATAAKRGRAAAPRAESRTEGARRSTRQQSKR